MRATTFTVGVVLAATLATGCASMRIGTYVARDTDFSRYHTFAWTTADALPVGDPRLDHNPILVDYLQGAVERGLQKHELLLVPPSAHPDLLVHFHGSVRQVVSVAGASRAHEYGVSEDVEVVTFDEGTLVIDLVDAGDGRLVWRGWAIDSVEGLVDSQDRMKQKVNEAVARLLANFQGL
jgi:hypothetical protein